VEQRAAPGVVNFQLAFDEVSVFVKHVLSSVRVSNGEIELIDLSNRLSALMAECDAATRIHFSTTGVKAHLGARNLKKLPTSNSSAMNEILGLVRLELARIIVVCVERNDSQFQFQLADQSFHVNFDERGDHLNFSTNYYCYGKLADESG